MNIEPRYIVTHKGHAEDSYKVVDSKTGYVCCDYPPHQFKLQSMAREAALFDAADRNRKNHANFGQY